MYSSINSNTTGKDKILLILMGVFAFSSFSLTVSFDFLHLPLTLCEPFFFFFLVLLRRRFFPITYDRGAFVVLCFLLLTSILLSQLLTSYSLYSVLSSSRGYFYLILFYCIFKRANRITSEDLLYVSFGSIIGWAISCVLSFREILLNPSEPLQTYGNMISVAVFIALAVLYKKTSLFTVGLVFLLIICFMSGIRRVIAVVFVALFLSYIFLLIRNKSSLSKSLLFGVIIAIPIFLLIPKLEKYSEENIPVLYYRLFTKTEQLFSGESGQSDLSRIDGFKDFQDNFTDYIMPRGMVSYQINEDPEVGIYIDFPLLALCRIVGLPVAICLLYFFMKQALKSFLYYRRTYDPESGVYVITTIVMIILLFVEGSFLVHPFTTPFTGLCLGKVVLHGHKYVYLLKKKHIKSVI